MGGPHKTGDKQRTYWISPEMEARFKEFAQKQGLSMSELIRISIDFYRESVQTANTTTTNRDGGEKNDDGSRKS